MFQIKICGITNIDDALAAADAGADAVGFNFYKSGRRFVEPEIARQIASALPKNVLKIGVFVNHTANEIADIVEQVALDGAQLHGDEHPEIFSQLPANVRLIRAHRCGRDGLAACVGYINKCRAAGRGPDAVLIDADVRGEYGGTGHVADWAQILNDKSSLGELPLILAGGLTPENVGAAIAAVMPNGVDVASGVESSPGKKDHKKLGDFIAAAREAFSTNS